ncbi:MAG: Mut7-C RNAse domain-containing protein [Candidatus Binatia bacterium]
MKFAADKMLGRLVKWLRVIGQDVTYGPHLSGYGLMRAARREGRLLLTRSRDLVKRNPPEYLLIESDHFREQLQQVVYACSLDPLKDAFSRCLECNNLLEPIAKDRVRERVPPYAFSTQESFSYCKWCQRVYWPATHQDRMMAELKDLGF